MARVAPYLRPVAANLWRSPAGLVEGPGVPPVVVPPTLPPSAPTWLTQAYFDGQISRLYDQEERTHANIIATIQAEAKKDPIIENTVKNRTFWEIALGILGAVLATR